MFKNQVYKISLALSLVIGLGACKKKEEVKPVNEQNVAGTVLKTASFVSSAHPTSGMAKVVQATDTTKVLRFEGFKTDAGPDLRVYLATTLQATTYVNLGTLKSVEGNQNYDIIPRNLDLNAYKYAIIWCEDFSVNFGYAELK